MINTTCSCVPVFSNTSRFSTCIFVWWIPGDPLLPRGMFWLRAVSSDNMAMRSSLLRWFSDLDVRRVLLSGHPTAFVALGLASAAWGGTCCVLLTQIRFPSGLTTLQYWGWGWVRGHLFPSNQGGCARARPVIHARSALTKNHFRRRPPVPPSLVCTDRPVAG